MAKRSREAQTRTYTCTITGKTYQLTREAIHPDDLVSVDAWYELHPEEDDRPEKIKIQAKERKAQEEALKALSEPPKV